MQTKNKSSVLRIEYNLITYSLVTLITVFGSCKKFVEVEAPFTSTNALNVYSTDATAIAVLTGIYGNISRSSPGGNFATGGNSISVLSGLSADELTLWSGNSNTTLISYYKNALVAEGSSVAGSEYWAPFYNYIFASNSAIEGLENSSDLTSSIRSQLLGEAKFMRAFFYFYLVNLFGDVPLVTTTDPYANATLSRTNSNEVYQNIIRDLKDAESLLSEQYLNSNLDKYIGSPERIRPTKWAAKALLARVYLFLGDYANAEVYSSSIINSSSLFKLTALKNAFLKNSTEAIWQLQPVNAGWNTDDARLFVIPNSGPNGNNPVYLSTTLLSSFELNDMRKSSGNWVGSITVGSSTYFYPYKYKINTQNSAVTSSTNMDEYLMILRLSEQYLIRAEARAQLNNVTDAQSDLNEIRKRAGLQNITSSSKTSLLTSIMHERQVELFAEWGHRWLDLKRTNTVDAVMDSITPKKGGSWNSYQQRYPLPLSDILKNPNLIQNSEY
jgi:starch-binding outer membrane protein, SusD/RagB family